MSKETLAIAIRAVGDICMTGITVDPFEHVSSLMDADLLFGNLECCLTERDTAAKNKVLFSASANTADYLVGQGFDYVCLANNHVLDYGAGGLCDTLDALETRGLRCGGAGRNASLASAPVKIETKGVRVALLSAADAAGGASDGPTICTLNMRAMSERIAELRNSADVVIASYHGGIELDTVPSPFVVRGLRGLIDAGADVVLAHHPHVLQAAETYKGRLVVYSLGNFVFDNARYGEKRALAARSMVLDARVTLHRDGSGWVVDAVSYGYIPVEIGEDSIPRPVAGDSAMAFAEYMSGLEALLKEVDPSEADVRRVEGFAGQIHNKSLTTVLRYAVRHWRDFSWREIVLGVKLVLSNSLRRRSRGRQ